MSLGPQFPHIEKQEFVVTWFFFFLLLLLLKILFVSERVEGSGEIETSMMSKRSIDQGYIDR